MKVQNPLLKTFETNFEGLKPRFEVNKKKRLFNAAILHMATSEFESFLLNAVLRKS